MSDSLRPHGLQHTRLPCPSPTLGACSNSCPSSQWCSPTISSSAVPFSSCLQSFPASGSVQMSQFITSGGQSIAVLASASVLPRNIQDWFPLGLTGLISLQSKELSRVFSIPLFKSINSLAFSFLYSPTLTSIQDYWKNHSLILLFKNHIFLYVKGIKVDLGNCTTSSVLCLFDNNKVVAGNYCPSKTIFFTTSSAVYGHVFDLQTNLHVRFKIPPLCLFQHDIDKHQLMILELPLLWVIE